VVSWFDAAVCDNCSNTAIAHIVVRVSSTNGGTNHALCCVNVCLSDVCTTVLHGRVADRYPNVMYTSDFIWYSENPDECQFRHLAWNAPSAAEDGDS